MAFNVLRGIGVRATQSAMQGAVRRQLPSRVLPKKVPSTPNKRESSTLGDAMFIINIAGLAAPSLQVVRAFQREARQKVATMTPQQRQNAANNIMGFGAIGVGLLTTAAVALVDQVKEMAIDPLESFCLVTPGKQSQVLDRTD